MHSMVEGATRPGIALKRRRAPVPGGGGTIAHFGGAAYFPLAGRL